MDLKNLIKSYDGAFSSSFCDHLIQRYKQESLNTYPIKHQYGQGTYFDVPLSEEHDKIMKIFQEHVEHYKDDVPAAGCWPEEYGWETIRIKKFKANDTDGYKTHVDVWDHASARRMIAFQVYLNTVDEGGRTLYNDVSIEPAQGRLIMFPPLWMYPHAGEAPKSNDKYILGSYLHYL
jgi:hypothetical protein|tara:strand:+ start:238 stop:768 length:531 start_codon:yes stop_codon:yes gene_type:complete